MRTKALAAALSGCMAISAGLVMVNPGMSYADTVPAKPSEADAVAVRVDPLLRISHTHATASQSSAQAKAAVIELSGAPLLAQAAFGGAQSGNGTAKGSLIDTGTTALAPLIDLKVTPWSATVANTDTHRHAESYAALLSLVVMNDKTLFVKLLQSSSVADHDDTTLKSTGKSVSDGAIIGVGGALTINILHAEASSENGGATWLLGVNDTKIGTNQQAGSACALNAAPLLALVCLNVVGGKGVNNEANDAIARVLPAANGGATATAGLSNVSSQTSSGTAVQAAPTPAPAPAPKVEAAQLPRTGAASMALVVLGMMLVLFGFAAVAVTRARRLAPVVA